METNIITGNCVDEIIKLENQSFDFILTDPPYPGARRSYGVMSEEEWHEMMDVVVENCRRILKPEGSAVFIIQPTGEHIGQMRTWVFDFIAKWGKKWNLIQDVIWFNITAPPNQWCSKKQGLLRPCAKYCVWLGSPNCYRNQKNVMWQPGDWTLIEKSARRSIGAVQRISPYSFDDQKVAKDTLESNEVTPFSIIPMASTTKKLRTDEQSKYPSEKAYEHPARTPEGIAHWWLAYACPPEGKVLDPFAGVATIGVAALKQKKYYTGIEQNIQYSTWATERLDKWKNILSKYNDVTVKGN